MQFFPTVAALHYLFLAVALWLWWTSTRKRVFFLLVSLVGTTAIYGIGGYIAMCDESEYTRLRALFPYESMEDRFSMPPPLAELGPLPESTNVRLAEVEYALETSSQYPRRVYMLQQLHEDRVRLFLNNSAFGAMRMVSRPSESGLKPLNRDGAPIPMPGPSEYAPEWTGTTIPETKAWAGEDLHHLHRDAVVDFVYPAGFGFFKDRRHVAGFLPHEFSQVPAPAEQWEVRRLELVSLILHEVPVAYVTENLPRMDELGRAATRPLDPFEASALTRLRRGEDLLYTEAPGLMRMLGSIRSARQCVECHGGERGDLLGAFSYTLRSTSDDPGVKPMTSVEVNRQAPASLRGGK